MKIGEFLLIAAKGVIEGFIETATDELAERNAAYEQQKRSENHRKGSIDAEFRVIKE